MKQRRYGTWPGAITPDAIAGSLRLRDLMWDTTSEALVWLEQHGKRGVLMSQAASDAPRTLTGDEFSVKARVGYGGGDFTVADGVIVCAGPGGGLYRLDLDYGEPAPITPEFAAAASPVVTPTDTWGERWVAFVFHHAGRDGIALVDLNGQHWPRILIADSDFAMQPAWSPDGRSLAYVAWDHPHMPWVSSELRLLHLGESPAGPVVDRMDVLTGDAAEVGVFQPTFSPDGRYIAYISDADGWPHLYTYHVATGEHRQVTTGPVDHGQPAWVQGMRVYGWLPDGRSLVLRRSERGLHRLVRIDVETGEQAPVPGMDAYTYLDQVSVSPLTGRIAALASASTVPPRIISADSATGESRVHRRATRERVRAAALSEAQAITWAGDAGASVHGLYYAPASESFYDEGPPPMIVDVHGGPTSQSMADYEERVQVFTTAGYAVLRVNHRGSTGYGRAYMEALRGNWGVYDVEDAASGALACAERGLADRARLAIIGRSAGGFTVLQSLVTKPGFYRAGISIYGITDQFRLAEETHKFESRYLDWLLGELPAAEAIYRERSPLFNTHRIRDAVLILQGAEDTVVPQNQADLIVASLREHGIPHAYNVYEGEGHGFRMPETIKDVYTRILAFLAEYVAAT